MAYDEKLADRVRGALKRRRGISEKKMLGGLAFLVTRKGPVMANTANATPSRPRATSTTQPDSG